MLPCFVNRGSALGLGCAREYFLEKILQIISNYEHALSTHFHCACDGDH